MDRVVVARRAGVVGVVGALCFGAMFLVAQNFSTWIGGDLWPTRLPVVIQLGLALIIGDFGAYWVHRTCHNGTLLWRLHAMHHTSERLQVLSSARNHPGNAIFAYGSQVIPLILLGANAEVLAALSVFTAVHGLLQHGNVDLRYGVFSYVFATADLHRWHHSVNFEESNTNFGSNLALWDHVFGTFHHPGGAPERVGLDDLAVRENFGAHLVLPVTMRD